jgi:iron complex outermembrane receptor protein
MCKYTFFLLFFAFFAVRVEAQTTQPTVSSSSPPDPTQRMALGTMVVTATRAEEPLKNIPASVSVVTAEAIQQRGNRYIGDELVRVPGIFVTKNDQGTYTSLTIRGVTARHHNDTFVTLLDGIPFITSSDEIDLEQISLALVDRVEVI